MRGVLPKWCRSRTSLALFLSMIVVATTVVQPALAAPDAEELSRARAKFQQGTELEQAGNWAAALQTFREVGQVKMTPQVRYHIALCEENLGKLVAALGGYELALAEADAVGPGFREEVEKSIERLRAQIPRLTIERGPGAQAATIELDGVSLGATSIGVPVPMDPGPHTLAARAPGYEPYSRTINAAEGGEETVTIELVKTEVDTVAPVLPVEPLAPVGGQKPGTEMRTLAYVVGGVGSVSLLTSGVFFYLMRSKMGDIEEYCGDDGTCRNDSLGEADQKAASDLESSIRQYYYLTLGTLGIGLGGLGAATYLYVRAHQMDKAHAATTQSWRVEPHAPGADVAGFSVVGRF